jgi:hypothetical protein
VKRSTVIALASLSVVLAGGGFWYFKKSRPVAAAVPVTAVPVVAASVTGKDVPIYLLGVGTVIAYNTDLVRSQIQGQLVQITFTEGQTGGSPKNQRKEIGRRADPPPSFAWFRCTVYSSKNASDAAERTSRIGIPL